MSTVSFKIRENERIWRANAGMNFQKRNCRKIYSGSSVAVHHLTDHQRISYTLRLFKAFTFGYEFNFYSITYSICPVFRHASSTLLGSLLSHIYIFDTCILIYTFKKVFIKHRQVSGFKRILDTFCNLLIFIFWTLLLFWLTRNHLRARVS